MLPSKARQPLRQQLIKTVRVDLIDHQGIGRLARDAAEAGDGRAWFNVGWLQAREAGAIRRCGVALREVAEATVCWER